MGVSSALSQQAELISWQLQELRRLEEEVRSLRETSLQQKMRLEAQALELDALAVAEKAGQAEAEGLRAALAGAEMVRKKLEEGSQRELQETKSLHQEQVSMGARGFQGASRGGGAEPWQLGRGTWVFWSCPGCSCSWESCDPAPFEPLPSSIVVSPPPPRLFSARYPSRNLVEGGRKAGMDSGKD